MSLPKTVIKEDRQLEGVQSQAAEKLMELRWHWTLDESNPERVSMNEYAKEVGRARSTIQADANGYALMSGGRSGPATPSEARQRANMGAETTAATEAVAEARGLSLKHARESLPVETRRVREMARQRAEDHGTSVEEEAPKVAEWIVKSEKAAESQKEQRTERLGLRFVEMEGRLTKAKTALVDALNIAHQVPWGDDERELLTDTLDGVKALIGLVDVALVGSADVDWDAELAKLSEPAA